MKSLEEEAMDALKSTTCSCGHPKKARHSFCGRCYFRLPTDLREDLYKPFSEGYAVVWEEARDWLKANKQL